MFLNPIVKDLCYTCSYQDNLEKMTLGGSMTIVHAWIKYVANMIMRGGGIIKLPRDQVWVFGKIIKQRKNKF